MAVITDYTHQASRFISTVPTGTAPHTVASTTLNANLNADLLDGQHGAHYLDLANATGSLADARLPESAVTQHEAALAIAWGQITGAPTLFTEEDADLLYLPLAGGTVASLISTGLLAAGTFLELTDAGTPANPAATKGRIFWDNTAGAVKAVNSAGTVITLGTIGGAITDAYSGVAGNSGTASASGGAQLSILGSGGVLTAAADGSPDTLTISLSANVPLLDAASQVFAGDLEAANLIISTGGVLEFADGTTMESAASGGLLAYKVHGASGSDGSYNTSSTSLVDVDATNLAVTFTAPPSGNVMHHLTAPISNNTAAATTHFGLREGSSDVPNSLGYMQNTPNANVVERLTHKVLETGLTPGNVYTRKFAWKCSSGATTSTMYYGASRGGIVMEVWSAP